MSADTTLVTGATGYIGRALVSHILETGDGPVIAWVHARSRADARRKRALLPRNPRLLCLWGELQDPGAFASVPRKRIRRIVHAAALTRFDIDRVAARQVNVAGARNVIRLARACPALERLLHLSSLYASGLEPGPVPEGPLDRPCGFANQYEWSKWRAEEELLKAGRDLPWQVLRFGTVIADDRSGRAGQRTVLHKMIGVMRAGLIPLVPAHPDARLFMTTRDAVIDAISALARAPAHRICNLAAPGARTPSVAQFVDWSFRGLRRRPEFRARGLLPPLIAGPGTLAPLLDGARSFAGTRIGLAFQAVQHFLPQLTVPKTVVAARLRTGGTNPVSPDMQALIEAVAAGPGSGGRQGGARLRRTAAGAQPSYLKDSATLAR